MKCIILDRDGVINEDSPTFIKSPEELIFIPGSLEAIVKLNQAGYQVFIATNQSGIARKLYDLDMLTKIHQKILDQLKLLDGQIEKIYFCPHVDEDNCDCRKPKPGLLMQIQKDYHTDFAKAFLIGDSYRDIQSARTANCPCLLVKTGNGKQTLKEHPELNDSVLVFDDLMHAANWIIETS